MKVMYSNEIDSKCKQWASEQQWNNNNKNNNDAVSETRDSLLSFDNVCDDKSEEIQINALTMWYASIRDTG